MDFRLSDEQEANQIGDRTLVRAVRRRVLVQPGPGRGFPHEFHQALAQAGWLGIAMPQAYGGAGLESTTRR